MKCWFCNCEGDVLMTDGKSVCLKCAEQKGLTTCTKLGKVVADPNFHCDNICNDCIYGEENAK